MDVAKGSERLIDVPEQRSARLALDAVVKGEGSLLLMLHGPAGSGKSRLIDHLLGTLPEDMTVARWTAPDDFANAGQAVGGDPELLVLEDVQFIPLNAVERVLAWLDEREATGRATVLTANSGPRHLRFRGDPYPSRLTSRLSGGLVVGVPLPGPESRRAILDAQLAERQLTVPDVVIAEVVAGSKSFRCLTGAAEQLKVLARLQSGSMDAGPLLDHFRQQTGKDTTSVERIVQRVAGHFRVSTRDVRSKSRRRGFVTPRHVSMYLARKLTSLSFNDIGEYFGGCDHATVLHACRKMEQTLVDDPQLGGAIRHLHEELT